jgi:hypothetical protein
MCIPDRGPFPGALLKEILRRKHSVNGGHPQVQEAILPAQCQPVSPDVLVPAFAGCNIRRLTMNQRGFVLTFLGGNIEQLTKNQV